METKSQSKANTADERTEGLTCWHTDTSPQCLRVETVNEVHLFPYGYFQHAKFIRQSGKDLVQIQFQERMVLVRGKNLEPLCDALERLAVDRIKMCPEKYGAIARNEGVIEDIEIKQRDKEN